MNKLTLDILKLFINDSIPIILCIGSDRVLGDCVAPMIGELLIKKYDVPTFVYGSLSQNVVLKNLQTTIDFIKLKHKNRKILVIDSGLGQIDEIGTILVQNGGIIPGILNGGNKIVGNFNIMPIIGTTGIDQKIFLRTTKIQTVTHLALTISQSISQALKIYSTILPSFDLI